jgi:peptidoglycan/LPS O-acetylase OafA/YrhL
MTALPVPTREPGLDLLRAAAIVTVMGYHLASHGFDMPTIGRHGWIGVDLFFVLSGYLIGWQVLRQIAQGQAPDWQAFLLRRALRVLPAYLSVLALYLWLPDWREAETMAPLWRFLTFTVNLFPDYQRYRAYSHAWSLCVEEHFYLLFPVAAWWLAGRRGQWRVVATFALLFAGGLLLRDWLWRLEVAPALLAHDAGRAFLRHAETIYAPTWTHLDGLVAGVLLATIRAFRSAWWNRLLRAAPLLLPAGVAAIVLALRLNPVSHAGAVFQFPLVATGFACMLAAALSPRLPLGRIAVPGARTVATLAFSLYLTHRQVYAWLDAPLVGLTGTAPLAAFGVANLAAFGVAALLYLGVERPGLRLRDRLLARRVARRRAALTT